MLVTTLLREFMLPKPLARVAEPDLIMDSEEAVSAFVRASQPNSILAGVHAFYAANACKMIRPGDRVLDLGCGPALLLGSLAKLCPEADFTGIDFSAGMIAAGRKQLRLAGTRNVELRQEDMAELCSVPSGSIDVVLSSMALHHLPDTSTLSRCLGAIERVLSPEGSIFLADFGRLKSVNSVEYFVRRAIPPSEPQLEQDYRASLRAAFSKQEFAQGVAAHLRRRVSVYSTVGGPFMLVLMSPFPQQGTRSNQSSRVLRNTLPRNQWANYFQLNLSLRLGGMPAK